MCLLFVFLVALVLQPVDFHQFLHLLLKNCRTRLTFRLVFFFLGLINQFLFHFVDLFVVGLVGSPLWPVIFHNCVQDHFRVALSVDLYALFRCLFLLGV